MNGDVKVADLGLCIEADECTSMAGSKYWVAPEVNFPRNFSPQLSPDNLSENFPNFP